MYNLLIFFLIVVVIGFIIYNLYFTQSAVVHGIIKKTKTKKIADVKDDEVVRISGKIIYAGKTMLAPLSGRKCVYYEVVVKDSSHRREFLKNHIDIKEEKIADVVIYDGENYAVINTKLVATSIALDQQLSSGFWKISTPELTSFLVKHGERSEDYMGWSLDLIGEEGVLEEGETLEVAGKAVWRDASDFNLRIPAKKILYINPLNEHGVYIADDIGSI